MYSHTLWRRALKLNKGIYKTTETVSDSEILKKQIREQANEILSTISVFCHRESAKHSLSAFAPSKSYKLKADSFPNPAPSASPHSGHSDAFVDSGRVQVSIRQPADKFHDFYVPESEICLMLLLDKITVLKTFLFLAKEHNFFSEEKYQILAAACGHLADSAQSELHGAALDAAGANIFSHSIFNSSHSPSLRGVRQSADDEAIFPSASPEVVPPTEVLRQPADSKIESALSKSYKLKADSSPDPAPSTHYSLPTTSPSIGHPAQIPDNLSDILDSVSDISAEAASDSLNSDHSPSLRAESDSAKQSLSDSGHSGAFADSGRVKAENYISKSIKSRQNKKTFKSYLPKFLKTSRSSSSLRGVRQSVDDEAISPSVPSTHYSLPTTSPFASPHSGHSGVFVDSGRVNPIGHIIPNQQESYPVALLDTVQSDFASIRHCEESAQPADDEAIFPFAIYSAPQESAHPFASPSSDHSPSLRAESDSAKQSPSVFPEVVPPLGLGGPTSKHSLSAFPYLGHSGAFVNSCRLTSRQQKLHNHILKHGKVKIGDLTVLFPEKISEKTVRRDLQALIDKSLVSQSGSRRWTYYSVKF